MLPIDFYRNYDVLEVSKSLLGKVLCSSIGHQMVKARITEVEAYDSPHDKACHAYGNKRTKRTEIMYEAGGQAYVYLCYGIHHLFNVVTGPADRAQAVLVRSILPIEGVDMVKERRAVKKPVHKLGIGPGCVRQCLGISTKEHNGTSLTSEGTKIWIEDDGYFVDKIQAGPRIGVDYAAECAAWPWRFWIDL